MRVVSFTSLYPNPLRPGFGVFVENRLRHLAASGQISLSVVAPVPWPAKGVPDHETRHGIHVLHPRFATIPGLGMYVAPLGLYRAGLSVLPTLHDMMPIDVLDAHYVYPDGVAAVWLGKKLGLPVVITARGTDINVLPEYAWPRRLIRQALQDADGLIAVSDALAARLVTLGADAAKIRVLRNGVDLQTFHPGDREAARARLGLGDGPVLASVGNLLKAKGQDVAIAALPHLPGVTLLLAGRGPDEGYLRTLAQSLGVANRVRFLGALPHAALPDVYRAADVLVHASMREGMANVLLEALACGTPVVGSPIPGMDEVVAAPVAGRIMKQRTPEALAASVQELLTSLPNRHDTRRYAEGFSWDATTAGQLALFRDILQRRTSSG